MAAHQRSLLEGYADLPPTTTDEARVFTEDHGFECLGPLTCPSLRDDPHRTKCQYCGRISAERLGDIGWGCTCQTNPRRTARTSDASEPRKPAKKLLKDSNLPVLDWWDHDANEATVWNTVTIKARREVSWCCPKCDLQFSERILDMTNGPRCPDCTARRKAEWEGEYERLKVTPIADVAELAEAWADDADPRLVTVTGHGMTLRRFRWGARHGPNALSPSPQTQRSMR